MSFHLKIFSSCVLLFLVATPRPCPADPCGMVPPIYPGSDILLTRIGVQKTYVFYRNGIETIVLRPGFSGKVDEFGMLIPFPAPPTVRKISDEIFPQIAAAIDPPEVVVDLRPPPRWRGFFGGGGGFGGGGLGGGGAGGSFGFVPPDVVRVVRQEAVGMYEVAVLAAGSAKALKRWMEDHGYVYPQGMDQVCNEYVADRWCFVAVKTRVKQKDAADPRPGQRGIDNDLPAGAVFDGHVQAMGFRFPSQDLVVPMRLSAFNPGELRNIVYLLADEPARIRMMPEEFVVRQVSFLRLFKNLTEPLPLRVIGGTVNDIPPHRFPKLKEDRDPAPHIGLAADLFASDAIAAKTGLLLSRQEELEKELHLISDELELRGSDVDRAVTDVVQQQRDLIRSGGLKLLNGMTLSVIDGNFPRNVIAKHNLTFDHYHMPRRRNIRRIYDANLMGSAAIQPGQVDFGELQMTQQHKSEIADAGRAVPRWAMAFGLVALIAMVSWRIGRGRAATILILMSLFWTTAGAQERPLDKLSMQELVSRLRRPDSARAAATELIQRGESAVPALVSVSHSASLTEQGWAIVCLGRIGGDAAVARLNEIHNANEQHLVRVWAAAALIKRAESTEALTKWRDKEIPELQRPIDVRARELLLANLETHTLDEMLAAIAESPELTSALIPVIRQRLKADGQLDSVERMLVQADRSSVIQSAIAADIVSAGAPPLLAAMLNGETASIRRRAASFVAALDARQALGESVAGAFEFSAQAEAPPWDGGALFVPALNWQHYDAQRLMCNLIAWRLWALQQDRNDLVSAIDINLISSLAPVAGCTYRGDQMKGWLRAYKDMAGNAALRKLLIDVDALEAYQDVVN